MQGESFPDWFLLPIIPKSGDGHCGYHPFIDLLRGREQQAIWKMCEIRNITNLFEFVECVTKQDILKLGNVGRYTVKALSNAFERNGIMWPRRDPSQNMAEARLRHVLAAYGEATREIKRLEQQEAMMTRAASFSAEKHHAHIVDLKTMSDENFSEVTRAHSLLDELGFEGDGTQKLRVRLAVIFGIAAKKGLQNISTTEALEKVLAPGHGFNSERSQRAENGGRP